MVQKQLVERCQNGDRKAQKELYDRYGDVLFGCSLKYASSYQEAQDILQDSFVIIFEKIDQFKGKGSLEGWCKRITINTALQRYRLSKVYSLEDDSNIADDSIEVEHMDQLEMSEMLSMVQELPDRYRLAFSLYALDGYSHKEIAELMKISAGTSKSNLSRARQILQQKVNKWREQHSSDAS